MHCFYFLHGCEIYSICQMAIPNLKRSFSFFILQSFVNTPKARCLFLPCNAGENKYVCLAYLCNRKLWRPELYFFSTRMLSHAQIMTVFFSFVTANFFNLLNRVQWVTFVINFLPLVVDSSFLGFFELKLRVHWDDF